MVDGEPIVIWSPKLSDAEAAKRVCTIYGKKTLEDSYGGEPRTIEPWTPVETPAQGGWRFFKVSGEYCCARKKAERANPRRTARPALSLMSSRMSFVSRM